MTNAQPARLGPARITTTVRAWPAGQTPGVGEPLETVEQVSWIDEDGTQVRDPERIAELEAERAARRDASRATTEEID